MTADIFFLPGLGSLASSDNILECSNLGEGVAGAAQAELVLLHAQGLELDVAVLSVAAVPAGPPHHLPALEQGELEEGRNYLEHKN